MMKVFACLQYRRILVVFCGLSLMAFLASPSALAEKKVSSERAKAIIGAKQTDYMLLAVHGFKYLDSNLLAVPYNPMIYDIDGTPLTLKDLKVPCEAYVEYKIVEDKDPQLLRLEVIGYNEDAKPYFTLNIKSKKLQE